MSEDRCREYNNKHRHSGIVGVSNAMVHYGNAAAVLQVRAAVLVGWGK